MGVNGREGVVMATMVTRTVNAGITAEEAAAVEGRELTMGIILVLEAVVGAGIEIEMTAEIDRETLRPRSLHLLNQTMTRMRKQTPVQTTTVLTARHHLH